MTTSAKLQILFVDAPRSGISDKTKKAWNIQTCQCAIHDDDGTIAVGEMMLPKGYDAPAPGFYDADFKIGVGFDKKVTGYLVGLRPCAAPKASTPAPRPV